MENIGIEDLKEGILSLGDLLNEAEGIGLFGSIVRPGKFTQRSDIDIFVIVKEKKPGIETDKLWWQRIEKVLRKFQRDVTVLVYTLKSLEKISHWYVLRFATEGILLYDKGEIKELFQKIVTAAYQAGMNQKKIGDELVWSFNKPNLEKRMRVSLLNE